VCKYLRAVVLVWPWEQRHDVNAAASIRQAIERVMAPWLSRQDLEELVAYMTR
jgi:cis-zeatin O-glucosyltransferase